MSDDVYKVKSRLKISTDDLWYDLFSGGGIEPEKVLVNQSDIDEVKKAVEVLKKFEHSLESQIKNFYY